MTNRELDKWLAENVMRWTLRKVEHSNNKELEGIPCWCVGSRILATDARWNPTESILDAFQVVEKMDSCLHLKQHGRTGRWAANFCTSTWEEMEADTLALAICLAAKEAMEERKGECEI